MRSAQTAEVAYRAALTAVAEGGGGRAEESADGRAEDARELGGERVGRDRPGEQPERDEHRAEGARRRLEERPGGAEQGGEGEDGPQPAAELRPDREPDGGQELGQVAEGEDAAAVVAGRPPRRRGA